jgi:hypothetical protein
MGFWTNKEHRTALDDAEDLAYTPSGGRVKMWLLGIVLALFPVGYGIYCLRTGHALMFGQNQDLDVTGSGATALAISYIAVGVFYPCPLVLGPARKGRIRELSSQVFGGAPFSLQLWLCDLQNCGYLIQQAR